MKELKLNYLILIALLISFFPPPTSVADDNENAQLLRAINLNEPVSVKTWLEKGEDPSPSELFDLPWGSS